VHLATNSFKNKKSGFVKFSSLNSGPTVIIKMGFTKYLLISWVTNYTHNRGVLTCLSHRELPEHWNGLTAKVHIFLNEIMKKSCDKFLPRFDDFVFFVTDSKIHQTLNFYLKSTKANRLVKVIRVLSGKFRHWIVHYVAPSSNAQKASQIHSKYAQQTFFNESKLRKQICM